MARDYKYRVNLSKKKPQPVKVAWWKWALVIVLIILFIYALFFLKSSAPEVNKDQHKQTLSVTKKIKHKKPPSKAKENKSYEPRFDFYTILPETEVIVPEYEINTRIREEKFGKGKASLYIMQAGSFRDFSEADKLRARLALMGIESKIEKAKIGNTIWNRVKMGPYHQSSSVSVIRKRLRQNNIDVIVTEIKG